jgi:HEAT repeat protein
MESKEPVSVATDVDPQPPVRVDIEATGPAPSEKRETSQHSAAGSRPPTPIELAIVAAMERRGARATTAPAPQPAPTLDPVTDAIARLTREPSGDVAAAVAGLREQVGSDALIARQLRVAAAQCIPVERSAVERLLVEVADIPALIELARRDGEDPLVQSAAMAALLKRPTPAGLNAYLSLVADPSKRETAIRASDQVGDPPVEALLARLDDPRVDVRVAAALVLGRINGPAVTRRLAAMVERNVNRREALIALTASHGPEARAYLAHASEVDELSAAVRSAMAQRTAYQ